MEKSPHIFTNLHDLAKFKAISAKKVMAQLPGFS